MAVVKVQYGVGNNVEREFATIQDILNCESLMDYLGCPDNVQASINGARVDGAFPLTTGQIIDLVAGANTKA